MIRFSFSVLVASLLFVGCGGGEPAAPAGEPDAVVDAAPAEDAAPAAPVVEAAPVKRNLPGDATAGEAVYNANCVACHQADGKGMGGALGADFVNDKTRLAKTNDELLKAIDEGVAGTTMIAWGAIIDETQRKDVLAYIRAKFGSK